MFTSCSATGSQRVSNDCVCSAGTSGSATATHYTSHTGQEQPPTAFPTTSQACQVFSVDSNDVRGLLLVAACV